MKSKISYKFFSICLAAIFFLYLGGSNSWAQAPPHIVDEYCKPKRNKDPNIPTVVNSLNEIEIYFISMPYRMNSIKTEDAFHLYAGEDEINDLGGDLYLSDYIEDPVLMGSILTFTPHFPLEKGIVYEVKIKSTAENTEGGQFDGDGDGTGGEDPDDDWVMKFIIDGNSPETGWSQIYDPENIFTENKVSSMIVDNQDWLWVGSEEGDVCYFDGSDWNCEKPFGNSDYVDDISCMTIDNEGCLWLGFNVLENNSLTPKLAKLVNINNNWEWEEKDLNNIPPDESIRDIAVDSENNLWIIASTDIYKYDGELHYCSPGGDGPFRPFIESLVIASGDNLWVRTADSELWQAEGGWWGDEYTAGCNYQINDINDMVVDSTGNIWIGTGNGLLKLDPSSQDPNWSKYSIDDGLPGNSINTLRIDPNNAFIWAGTSDVLAKFDLVTGFWSTYFEQTLGEDINHLAINTRGEVWFERAQGIQMWDEILPYVLESESFPHNEDVINTAQDIRIVFSEPMNHEITESAFTIIEDGDNQPIKGELFWQDTQTLLFDTSSLAVNKYEVQIDTSAEDMHGNLLSNSYKVGFSIAEQSKKDSHYSPNYFLYPYNNYNLYSYNNMDLYNNIFTDTYSDDQFFNIYQTPVNFQQQSPLQLYNIYPIYPTRVNYQNQAAMLQWPSWNFSSPFDRFCTGLLQTWYQKLLVSWPHQFNQQSYKPAVIQSTSLHQPQGQVSQFNQQTYKPAVIQSTTLHQPQYQNWNLKENQQQQTLNLQKQQKLMNVQPKKSWTQTFQPYYR